MTDEEKLNIVRLMVDGSETDDVLLAYLKLAGSAIIAKAYPYRDDVAEVPAKYEYIQCNITAHLVNKRGAEGETAHSENGVSRTYENGGIPTSMLRDIVPLVGVI